MNLKNITAEEKIEFFREENIMGLLEKEALHIVDKFDNVEKFIAHMKGYNRAMISTLDFLCVDAPKPMRKFASGEGKQKICMYLTQLFEYHQIEKANNEKGETEGCQLPPTPYLINFLGKKYL